MINNIFKSGLGGSISGLFYLLLAYLLDKKYDEKTSNIIAFISSGIMNFIFQYNIFSNSKSKFSSKYIVKYASLGLMQMIINQLLVSYLLDKKHIFIKYVPNKLKEYYPTIIRALVESFIFLCIYPLRSKWVFI